MFNKPPLLIENIETEATVVLRIHHFTGDLLECQMYIQYLDPPQTRYNLVPPIPIYKTEQYTIQVPKGMNMEICGGNNDLNFKSVTPKDAAIVSENGYRKCQILDSCVIEGEVDTY